MNPFADGIDAEKYDSARPNFHPLVFERLAGVFRGPFAAALDVGCGTGQSTKALASVSAFVVGLDASATMLRVARRRDANPYVRGSAERLPFRDGASDVVTVGLGLHWFGRTTFLNEAHRVLRSGAWLLIYDSGFCGRMRENPVFGNWVLEYRRRFPAPARNDGPIASETLVRLGFTSVLSDRFVHREVYDLEQLARYLETQSNIQVALRQDRDASERAAEWLRSTLRPLFPGKTATFEYEGWMMLFQKAG